MTDKTKLIIGLGNPGDKYKSTRHNIGFEIITNFCSKHGIELKKESKFEAKLGAREFTINYTLSKKTKVAVTIPPQEEGEEETTSFEKKTVESEHELSTKIICALPQTYMNDSGRAVNKILNYYKINAEDLLVIHDDVSLETGKIRAAFNRGAGGQHGVEDIIEKLSGSKSFHRLKIGVGPDPGGDERNHYVLAKFPKAQRDTIEETIINAIFHTEAWLTGEDYQQISKIKLG